MLGVTRADSVTVADMSTDQPRRWQPPATHRTASAAERAEVRDPLAAIMRASKEIDLALNDDSISGVQLAMDATTLAATIEETAASLRRATAVSAIEHGLSYREVASFCRVSHQTVRTWVADAYETRSLDQE